MIGIVVEWWHSPLWTKPSVDDWIRGIIISKATIIRNADIVAQFWNLNQEKQSLPIALEKKCGKKKESFGELRNLAHTRPPPPPFPFPPPLSLQIINRFLRYLKLTTAMGVTKDPLVCSHNTGHGWYRTQCTEELMWILRDKNSRERTPKWHLRMPWMPKWHLLMHDHWDVKYCLQTTFKFGQIEHKFNRSYSPAQRVGAAPSSQAFSADFLSTAWRRKKKSVSLTPFFAKMVANNFAGMTVVDQSSIFTVQNRVHLRLSFQWTPYRWSETCILCKFISLSALTSSGSACWCKTWQKTNWENGISSCDQVLSVYRAPSSTGTVRLPATLSR